jgi:DNA-binding NarL/FixJ family response regulator
MWISIPAYSIRNRISILVYGVDFTRDNISALAEDMTEIRRIHPTAPVIFLAGDDSTKANVESLKLGAQGYIPGSATFDIAIAAMQVVRGGGTYLPHTCVADLAAAPADAEEKEDQPDVFTPRQMAVLVRLRHGKANRDIASELNMSGARLKHTSAISCRS